jgi:hypothetical protein
MLNFGNVKDEKSSEDAMEWTNAATAVEEENLIAEDLQQTQFV